MSGKFLKFLRKNKLRILQFCQVASKNTTTRPERISKNLKESQRISKNLKEYNTENIGIGEIVTIIYFSISSRNFRNPMETQESNGQAHEIQERLREKKKWGKSERISHDHVRNKKECFILNINSPLPPPRN